jgi:hypothetical protein
VSAGKRVIRAARATALRLIAAMANLLPAADRRSPGRRRAPWRSRWRGSLGIPNKALGSQVADLGPPTTRPRGDGRGNQHGGRATRRIATPCPSTASCRPDAGEEGVGQRKGRNTKNMKRPACPHDLPRRSRLSDAWQNRLAGDPKHIIGRCDNDHLFRAAPCQHANDRCAPHQSPDQARS